MERRYVGIDLHRRRSVVVTMDQAGEVLSAVRIANDPVAMSIAVAEAGEGAEVAFEATYGWYWLADQLTAEGYQLHPAHPLAMRGMTSHRRVKDATLLDDVLRMGSLPEGWIAPPELRELRELVRWPSSSSGSSTLLPWSPAASARRASVPLRCQSRSPRR